METSALSTQEGRLDTAKIYLSLPDHLANEFINSRKRDICSTVVTSES